MAADARERLLSGTAWREFCDRLKTAGERILDGDFPGDSRGRAEGFRHVARLAVYGLQWSIEFSDSDFPAFYRFDDDVVKWGGPNVDNHYQRAKISPSGTYRLTGDVSGVRELILSTPEGDMQLDQYRVFEERSLAQLEVGPDRRLEVMLSAEPHPGNWIPLHPGVDHVLIRQYVADWERDRVATFHIEEVGHRGSAPAPLEPARVADALDRAATWIERTVVYWNEYLKEARTRLRDNVLGPPRSAKGGAADILYGSGFWKLAPDEALLVDCECPDARYWCFQLYTLGWFESLDVANRQNSMNGEQARIDDDGRIRIVVAHEDPGVENWLDTEGRAAGMISYRWVWARTAPAPVARVVPLAGLREHLPPSTRRFSSEERRDQIARRRAGVTRRFRT